MQGFSRNNNVTKYVCLVNAFFIIPYLLSAFYFIFKCITDTVFREYHGFPSLFYIIVFALFIIFYLIMFYGLLKTSKWIKWMILIDAIAGFLLVYTFGFVGAYALGVHPGQFVYVYLIEIEKYFNWKHLFWYAFILKVSFNTFNIIFFFGNPIFNLAKKYRLAHAFWIIPSLILIGMPLYETYRAIEYTNKHFSDSAEKIAKEEFRKITCDMVRKNNGKKTEYQINNYRVRITFDYDYTGVWVTTPDGKEGRAGGPKYFCRPDYKGPRK
jgi:hypothetical protein